MSCATLGLARQVSAIRDRHAVVDESRCSPPAPSLAGDTVGVSRLVPITPKQIAESAIDAAKAERLWFTATSGIQRQAPPARREDLYRGDRSARPTPTLC